MYACVSLNVINASMDFCAPWVSESLLFAGAVLLSLFTRQGCVWSSDGFDFGSRVVDPLAFPFSLCFSGILLSFWAPWINRIFADDLHFYLLKSGESDWEIGSAPHSGWRMERMDFAWLHEVVPVQAVPFGSMLIRQDRLASSLNQSGEERSCLIRNTICGMSGVTLYSRD
jgi:hypothetical protein